MPSAHGAHKREWCTSLPRTSLFTHSLSTDPTNSTDQGRTNERSFVRYMLIDDRGRGGRDRPIKVCVSVRVCERVRSAVSRQGRSLWRTVDCGGVVSCGVVGQGGGEGKYVHNHRAQANERTNQQGNQAVNGCAVVRCACDCVHPRASAHLCVCWAGPPSAAPQSSCESCARRPVASLRRDVVKAPLLPRCLVAPAQLKVCAERHRFAWENSSHFDEQCPAKQPQQGHERRAFNT